MFTEKCITFLSCPIDGHDMKLSDKTIYCTSGHSFDISREGYINMLTSKKRFHENVGDNKEMLLSREHFLEKGYFDFLSEEINRIIIKHLRKGYEDEKEKQHASSCVLEVGSGTAFYLKNLKTEIEKELLRNDFCYFGTDVSKEATKLSAKKYKDISFLVADTDFNIPFKNEVAKILLNIFSPRNSREFVRLLKNNGLLIVVIPNNNHLNELIDELGLIGIEKDKKEHLLTMFNELFKKVDERDCEQKLLMDSDSVVDIVKMGPSYKYVDNRMIQKIRNMGSIKITASFNISLYTKIEDFNS